MSRNILEEALNREIQRSKEPISVEEAVAMLTGRDNRIVAKPAKKYSKQEKAERAVKLAALKAKRDGTDSVDTAGLDGDGSQADPIVEESEKELQKEDEEYLLSKFPDGTIMNDDETLTLPDGRMIRKIQEV